MGVSKGNEDEVVHKYRISSLGSIGDPSSAIAVNVSVVFLTIHVLACVCVHS